MAFVLTCDSFSCCRKEEAVLESAAAAASDVTTAMMAVKIELEEKKRTNDLLQRALVSRTPHGALQTRSFPEFYSEVRLAGLNLHHFEMVALRLFRPKNFNAVCAVLSK